MYSVDDLKQQNRDICELCDVLSVLMEQKTLHSNRYVCELMSRFREKVWMHLVFEDNTLYAELARHHDEAVSETARSFHHNAKEIKKRFSSYVSRWCKTAVDEGKHEALVNESREIFRLIRERVDYENEQMFPLLE
jgi:hemerythrin-like domain-containing protein